MSIQQPLVAVEQLGTLSNATPTRAVSVLHGCSGQAVDELSCSAASRCWADYNMTACFCSFVRQREAYGSAKESQAHHYSTLPSSRTKRGLIPTDWPKSIASSSDCHIDYPFSNGKAFVSPVACPSTPQHKVIYNYFLGDPRDVVTLAGGEFFQGIGDLWAVRGEDGKCTVRELLACGVDELQLQRNPLAAAGVEPSRYAPDLSVGGGWYINACVHHPNVNYAIRWLHTHTFRSRRPVSHYQQWFWQAGGTSRAAVMKALAAADEPLYVDWMTYWPEQWFCHSSLEANFSVAEAAASVWRQWKQQNGSAPSSPPTSLGATSRTHRPSWPSTSSPPTLWPSAGGLAWLKYALPVETSARWL